MESTSPFHSARLQARHVPCGRDPLWHCVRALPLHGILETIPQGRKQIIWEMKRLRQAERN